MKADEVRQRYINFFKERGHAIIPSAPLVPENDPTTLFIGSGMQPLLPYLLGEKHPKGIRLVNSQKCFRAEDIEEVGDNRHTTFFEMLGNWSLSDYFKKEQLPWFFEFLTDEIGLDPKRLYVTVFAEDKKNNIPKDDESVGIWKELFIGKNIEAKDVLMGSEEDAYNRGMKEGERIFYYEGKTNWWSRAGSPENTPVGEPGGPDSEVFYDFGTKHDPSFGEHCHPNCDCGRFVEIGNSVFMTYIKKEDGSFEQLKQKNVDFGGGLERIAAASEDDPDVFKVDVLSGIIQQLQIWTGKEYTDTVFQGSFRIITDHIRGAIFMIDDGVTPSNTDKGYLLRRLIRRAVFHADKLGVTAGELYRIIETVGGRYKNSYPSLNEKKVEIADLILKEETAFRKTLERGLKEFEKLSADDISGHDAFVLFSTYGFPLELTLELAGERGVKVDEEAFRKEMEQHQEQSRSGAAQKFKGGLADNSGKVVQYHTATHLLLAGLRKELGDDVHQAGSNITAERTRFDFTHPEKVSREILDRVEEFVNDAVCSNASVKMETIKKEEAEQDPSIEGSFWEKYPDEVNVYSVVGDNGAIYSKELCGGPHVENTTGMGTFRITKEEASSAGVRRVKAVLE